MGSKGIKFQIIGGTLAVLTCSVVAQRGKSSLSDKPAQDALVLGKPQISANTKGQIRDFEVARETYTSPITSSQALKAVAIKTGRKARQFAADKDAIEFTPRHYFIPGCTFETTAMLEFRAAPKAFCWPITQRGDINIRVPITVNADFAVVTVNGSFPSKSNTMGLNVADRGETNQGGNFEFIVTKDNSERVSNGWLLSANVGDHFNSNLVVELKGTKSIQIQIISGLMKSYTFISSVQVHYVSAI